MPQIVPAPDLGVIPRLQTDRKDGKGKVRLPAKPDAIWHYTKADGSSFGYVIRWNETDTFEKVTRPLTYQEATDAKQEGWQWKGFSKPSPLLYLPEIYAAPMCPVLVVEGEKTADGARRYLPDGWGVTTWQGGVPGAASADWSTLAGHSVVLWPDNDDIGIVTMAKILQTLQDSGIAAAIIDLPRDLPEKYDLGDDLPATLTASGVRDLILKTASQCIANLPAPVEPLPTVTVEPIAGIDNQILIVPLGYGDRAYYFLAKQSQRILKLSGREIQDRKALMELCTDVKYWYRNYGSSAETMDWARVGSDLMDQCHAAGVYNPDNERGRGCWIDKGRVVFHGGDRLLVDGVACEPIAIQSRYIYQKRPQFFDLTKTTPLTTAEGKNLLKICKMFPWKGSDLLTSDLACGGIAAAPICGALTFRSNYWVSGPTSSGKSYFVREFAGRCAGTYSMRPLANSTEAGIRGELMSEAVPVIFDEAEAMGPEGEGKRQMIIQMMRMSTQDTGGKMIIGQSGGLGSKSFRIQTQFMLSSIGVGLREAADVNRCIVLTLENPTTATSEDQERRIEAFARLEQAVGALPWDMPQKLLSRMLAHVNDVRALSKELANHLMRKLGKSTIRRVGELLATPLACMWFLTHDQAPAEAEIDQWLSRYNLTPWEGGSDIVTSDEGIAIIRHLTDQQIRVEFSGGGTGERTVGALLANVTGVECEEKIPFKEAQRALDAYGLQYDGRSQTVIMSTASPNLDKMLRGGPYAGSYISILGRRTGVKRAEKTMWVGKKANRPLMIPIMEFLGDHRNAERIESYPIVMRASDAELPYEPGMDG